MTALPCPKAKRGGGVATTCRHKAAEQLMARDAINHLDYPAESQTVHCVQWAKPAQYHRAHTLTLRWGLHTIGFIDTWPPTLYVAIKILPNL